MIQELAQLSKYGTKTIRQMYTNQIMDTNQIVPAETAEQSAMCGGWLACPFLAPLLPGLPHTGQTLHVHATVNAWHICKLLNTMWEP